MSRIKRYFLPGAIYYVTSVTDGRHNLFTDARACRFFITCLEYHKQIFAFKTFGFVIMPEHFHCVIQPALGTTISKIIQHIKGNFARKYNFMRKEGGYIWQQSFYDRVIQSEVQLSNEINYMHYNPVRTGLVDSPGDYEFSSYRYYFGEDYRNLVDRIA